MTGLDAIDTSAGLIMTMVSFLVGVDGAEYSADGRACPDGGP